MVSIALSDDLTLAIGQCTACNGTWGRVLKLNCWMYDEAIRDETMQLSLLLSSDGYNSASI